MPSLKIDIAVGGRFHSDFMVKYFREAGHDVKLYTCLPRSRFSKIPSNAILSFPWPEVIFRVGKVLGFENWGDQIKITQFGKRVASHLSRREPSDIFIGWSSFSLESLRLKRARHAALVRDSTHIAFQSQVLEAEYQKLKLAYPERRFVVEREEEEYQLADTIIVLSEFAKRTFLERGVSEKKLQVIRLGVDTSLFQPVATSFHLPLRVVYFGLLSVRKGVHHLLEATREFSPKVLELSLVGPIEREFKPVLRAYRHAKLLGPMSHPMLSKFLNDKHVFVFPTLEDGFGQTLIQAMASGLVPIATSHCGAAELIREGTNGFIVGAGKTHEIRECLLKIIDAPEILSGIRGEAIKTAKIYSWDFYGRSLTSWVNGLDHCEAKDECLSVRQ